ncbi:hypothetical protein [Mammaliicoccus sciuri]|uniref:hypothetical protein n=1 Tax=Mammaliicoccus sciuri TaxID=1296 RepID=UPI0021D1436E|nr:hypothetical protein [Mammaliicoccus sciuri]UXU70145.1 hypothetical protein MUA36_05550 [Mammaliicoccus sciuri]
MNKFKLIDEHNNTVKIVDFEQLKNIAIDLNNTMIKDTPYFEDKQNLYNKDFNNLDVIKETLYFALIDIENYQ